MSIERSGAPGQRTGGTQEEVLNASQYTPSGYANVPHSTELEADVLSSVMYGRTEPAGLNLSGRDFYSPDHEALWNVIVGMGAHDPVLVREACPDDRLKALVVELAGRQMAAMTAEVLAPEYAQKLRDLTARRDLQTSLTRALQEASQPDADPGEILAKINDVPKRSGDGIAKAWKATELAPSKPLDWLAVGRVPFASVAAMAGEEGIGKSLFDAWLCSVVTTGRAVPEFGIPARDPMDVCLVLTEDDWQTIARPRFEAAGVDLDHVYVICESKDGSGSPEFPKDMRPVYDSGASLVLVDAFADTVEARFMLKDGQQARKALHPWKEYASKTGAAVLLLTHTNRTDTRSTRNAWGYSAEIRKKVRVGLLAQEDEDGNLAIGSDKLNVDGKGVAALFKIDEVQFWPETPSSRGTVPVLKYTGESEFTAKELFAQAYDRDHPQPEKKGRALGEDSQKVVDFVATQAKAGTVTKTADVAEFMGWDAHKTSTRLSELTNQGKLRRVVQGVYTIAESGQSGESGRPGKQEHSPDSGPDAASEAPSGEASGESTCLTGRPDRPDRPDGESDRPLSVVPDDPCGFCGKSLTQTPGQRVCGANHRRAQEAAS